MSIFNKEESIEAVFTKGNIIQSIIDGNENGRCPRFYYKDYPLDHKLQSYVLLTWQLDEDSVLGSKQYTGDEQLCYVTALFDSEVDSSGDVIQIKILSLRELEIEHADSISGIEGEFYIRGDKLTVGVSDFKEVIKDAAVKYNEASAKQDLLNGRRTKRINILEPTDSGLVENTP
ncbi:MAG: hypothetical protein VYA60_04265 [Pseudomonadota bacterium]|nr:hypothetical protein [Pseudomonadota bacterium]